MYKSRVQRHALHVSRYLIERDPFALPREPLRGLDPIEKLKRVTIVKRDIVQNSAYFNGWTWKLVEEADLALTNGQFAMAGFLCDAALGDSTVQSTMGSRVDALTSSPVQHRASRDGDKIMAKAALDAWRDNFKRMLPKSVLARIDTFIVLAGFCICEIRWDTTGPIWMPVLKFWHPKHTFWDPMRRQYAVITMDGVEYIEPGDGQWCVFAPHGMEGGWMFAAIRAIGPKWLLRHSSFSDWASYSERHGQPGIVVESPANAPEDEVAEVVDGFVNMKGGTVFHAPQGIDNQGYKAYMLEATDGAWESFDALSTRCDKDIIAAILRQPLVGENGTDPGSREHAGARQTTLEFDAAGVEEALYSQVARPFCYFNFGDADLAPVSSFQVKPVEDVAKKIAIFEGFTRGALAIDSMGYEFNATAFARQFGLSIPGLKKKGDQEPYEKPTTELSDGEAVGTGAGAAQPNELKGDEE